MKAFGFNSGSFYIFVQDMRAVIQRVSEASVCINGDTISSISDGLLVLLGIDENDAQEDIDWLAGKIARLRIFNDKNDVMNLSVVETSGEILVVSQFTLHASTKKGNRPSYIKAAKPEIAVPIYKKFLERLEDETGAVIKTGEFGAMMQIKLINNGPVTILIDTKNKE